ncbi:MAG: HIT domain-containing protein [Aggregatilineales bacterium]
MPWTIPAKRLHETDTLLAFHHPVPSYPVHILIVPKRGYENMMAIDASDTAFMQDVFITVQQLITRLALDAGGYRLICNGGAYQDVKLLHFHLISDAESQSI